MIHKSTIDAVFDTARLEEVIGDFVQLKKSGANFKGLSPFTDERSPSFMVSPVKQIWKDFSSGKGGNVVTFLMEHEHFSYPEAIRYLAKKYNIDIAETEQNDEQKAAASQRESMYLVSNYAVSFFEDNIWNTPQGKAIGLSYFNERGFSEETIRFFQLGYSPDTWSALTDAAQKAGYQLDFLEKTGLSIVKGDKKFDRFKGRVMFPIHSMSGRVLGFGGRILTQDKKAAKYMNSPESEIYNKSKVLYGLYQAKHTIAKENNCYLVEGYTDVIQMYQRGVKNVVSSSGTALTPEQIRLIGRLTKNITVLFDGDPAGLRASLRGIDLILEAGMNVRVCMFPEGEDPDSFARENSVEDVIDFFTNNSKDFIQFKAALLVDEADFLESKTLTTLNKYLKVRNTSLPCYIIIICNQAQQAALRTMKSYVEIVYFNKISDSEIFLRLVDINKQTGKNYTKKTQLNNIVTSSNGDLRQAINMMQTRTMEPEGIDKDTNLTNNLFDFGTYLLTQNTSESSVKKDIFLATNLLHENIYRQKFNSKKKESQYIAKLAETLSDIDLLDTVYGSNFQASIINLSCNMIQAKYKKPIVKLNFPSILGHISSKTAASKNLVLITRTLGHTENYLMLQKILKLYHQVKSEKNKLKKIEIESFLKQLLKPLKLNKDMLELFQKPVIGHQRNLPSLYGLLK